MDCVTRSLIVYVRPRVDTYRAWILGAEYQYQISRNLVSILVRIFVKISTVYEYSVGFFLLVSIIGDMKTAYRYSVDFFLKKIGLSTKYAYWRYTFSPVWIPGIIHSEY